MCSPHPPSPGRARLPPVPHLLLRGSFPTRFRIRARPTSDYFSELARGYLDRRDLWLELLKKAGFSVHSPGGTYFVMTDVRHLGFECDLDFCRRLPQEVGVAAIPASVFYHQQAGRGLVRWAFCKSLPTLQEAGQRLLKLDRMARTVPNRA